MASSVKKRYVYSIDVVLDFESGDITGYNFGVVIKRNVADALQRLDDILTAEGYTCEYSGDKLRTYRREIEEDMRYDKANVTVCKRALDHTYGAGIATLIKL